MDLSRLIRVARGDAEADVVFTNARIVNTFTGEIEEGNVAVAEGRVAGIGDYTEAVKDRRRGRSVTWRPASSTDTSTWRARICTSTSLRGLWCPGARWPPSPTCTRSQTWRGWRA